LCARSPQDRRPSRRRAALPCANPVRHIGARIILAWARENLPQAQYDALVPWLDHASYDEIAREQNLEGGADEAMHLVRAAVERLRYHFAGERARPQGPLPRLPRRRAGPK
jgi:hypothetical protein